MDGHNNNIPRPVGDLRDLDGELLRFSVSLPKKLLMYFDSILTKKGYASRSELVRDMIRERLIQEVWDSDDKNMSGVLVVVYDHCVKELSQRITDIQHSALGVKILYTTHVDLDHHNCLETMVLSGLSSQIQRIVSEIRGLKGVKNVGLTKAILFDVNE